MKSFKSIRTINERYTSEKHVSHFFGMKENTELEEADDVNLRIIKHEKQAVEAEKRGDKEAQQFHLNKVKVLKQKESVQESTKTVSKHLVTVTVSDPHHPSITLRKAKIMKRVKVSAKDPKDAEKKAEAHYKKHGFKVHDSYHHSMVKESVDSDEIIDSKLNEDDHEAEEIAMAKSQFKEIIDMTQELVDSMDDADELEPWMHQKITTAYNSIDDVYTAIAYGEDSESEKSEEDDDDSDSKKEDYPTEAVKEALENDSDDADDVSGLSDEEKASLSRIKTLMRLGLLDRQQAQTVLRAVKKLDLDQPVSSTMERQAIADLLQNLIGVVTGDDTIFRKVRIAVQK